MKEFSVSEIKLGIIAGGQLSKMLIQEATKWDIKTYVLDSDEHCPAKDIATFFVRGDRLNFTDVYSFGKMVDVLTFEIESINTDALFKLKDEGLIIHPDPFVLTLIQDKGKQKEFYRDNNIPTSNFHLFDSKEDIIKSVYENKLTPPFVQKIRKGGYDGRGVKVVDNQSQLDELLPGASIIEDKIDIKKEISIIVARNKNGETETFPAVEMIFNEKENILDKLICPAYISKSIEKKAANIAVHLAEKLNIIGLLAVEFFVDRRNNILVNEIAPRPHNSGHHTIENNLTSQYEQHLRAILDLPLGRTKMKSPAVMINLLGEDGYNGHVKYKGFREALSIEGVKIHLYGKKITKPYRKMGHITIISDNLKDAISKADKLKKIVRVIS
ncbi:MAG: 5-(carboxyamino)imidazole ribonucleotide synthase [Brevinematales bacterium]|nr:5-(carboxyamino)imidazole ribonucleotide synthase [Brevinematales bacterium]